MSGGTHTQHAHMWGERGRGGTDLNILSCTVFLLEFHELEAHERSVNVNVRG